MLVVAGCKREPQAPQSLLGVGKDAPAVTEWDKVKLGVSGEIFLNKKPISLAELVTECERLKKAGGGIVLYVDTPNHVANPAQVEAMQKIVDAGVAMKVALEERDLN